VYTGAMACNGAFKAPAVCRSLLFWCAPMLGVNRDTVETRIAHSIYEHR